MDLKSSSPSSILTETPSINKSWMALIPNSLICSSPPATFSAAALQLTIPRKKTGLLDDVRASGWLDAMKASSPPPRMMMREFNNEDAAADADTVYRTWMLKYPSAILSFDQIISYATGKKIVLFLDYDGTLSPIVDNPDRAFMSRSMRKAVKNAAKLFPTAIISGRSRDKVFGFVGLTELYYAGSHGMDIMSPVRQSLIENQSNGSQNQKESLFQPASEFLPMIDEVLKALIEATKDIDGAKVENNKFCVSVHYRNVEVTNWQLVGELVANILKGYPKLRLTHGRKVLEVRPVIDWDKGKAVMFLLESLGLNNCEDVLPIYVGDDRTDEDAFKVLREGNRGYGILVSSVPKESSAYYSLRDPSEVMEFLKALVRSKKL